MGAFSIRIFDRDGREEIASFEVPNVIVNEAFEALYHRIFPAISNSFSFAFRLAGCHPAYPEDRPNDVAQCGWTSALTYAAITAPDSEGSCFDDEMRASYDYPIAGEPTTFLVNERGEFESDWEEFKNAHSWTPQPCQDWYTYCDFDEDTKCPPAWWNGWQAWLAEIGFPWFQPRKRMGHYDCGWNPDYDLPSYMEEWTPPGDQHLDWLADFYMMHGFPVSGVALCDETTEHLVACSELSNIIQWWPDVSIWIKYRGRITDIDGICTYAFCERAARMMFGSGATGYDIICARPALSGAPTPTRERTIEEYDAYFVADVPEENCGSWGYAAGPPPHVTSAALVFDNESEPPDEETYGPFAWLVVYGKIGTTRELMWATPISPVVTLEPDDRLRFLSGAKFTLERV